MPFYPEDTTLSDMERRIAALETAQRAGFTSIGAGGLTIKDDGQIELKDGTGNTLAVLSTAGLAIYEADGSVKITLTGAGLKGYDASGAIERVIVDEYGLQVNDDTGERVRFGDVDHAGDFGGRMKDTDGNVVWRRTDAGTWRPTRQLGFLPDHAAVQPTASPIYDQTWRAGAVEVWEDAFSALVTAWCDSGATYSLRFSVYHSGASTPDAYDEITGLTNTAPASFQRKVQIPYGGSYPDKGESRSFTVDAKRTAGAGNVYVQGFAGVQLGLLADLPSETGP